MTTKASLAIHPGEHIADGLAERGMTTVAPWSCGARHPCCTAVPSPVIALGRSPAGRGREKAVEAAQLRDEPQGLRLLAGPVRLCLKCARVSDTGSSMARRTGSQASQVAGAVLRARRRFFRIDDFEGSRAAVDRELCRLVAAGELRRIRNGLYWRGPKTMLGIAPPALDELLEELLGGCTYGPAGLSAANAFGLTSQVPGRDEIAVTGRPPRDLPTVRFVQRSGRRGRQSARLRPEEVGFLEILNDLEAVRDELLVVS